ncbi:unnamed protein product [Lymnaea stagnalis]|uniref:Uncharacterized protein n=1 Tax=Lymnaea stagnalis TaxID=6523 RepID=A0AAV2IMG3_LYMST
MSLNTCNSLGYCYGNSFCVPVGVDKDQDEYTIQEGWIAGAFFLGLLIGAGIILILAKPFLNALEKKKRQDEERLLDMAGNSKIKETKSVPVQGWIDKENGKALKGKKSFKVSRFWRKKHSLSNLNEKEIDEAKEGDVDPAWSRGMVDVMQQTTNSNSEVEMLDQDMAAIISMERSLEEEKETLLLKTLAMILKKKAERRGVTQNFCINFMKKTEEDIKDLTKMIEREKEEAEEKIRNDTKFVKDSEGLETEMQKIHTHFNNKKSKLQRDYRDKLRQSLLLSSGMSESEIDELIEKLMNNMAVIEEKIGNEQARQRRAVEQRLAKRKRDMQYREVTAREAETDIEARVDTLKKLLSKKLKEDSNQGTQMDSIISDYSDELNIIHRFHSKDFDDKCSEKYDLLQNFRLSSFFKLMKKQEKEKAIFLQTADKTTNTVEFNKLFHDLFIKHHMEQEALCGELDQKEIQEISKLRQTINNNENTALDKETEKLVEKLESLTNLKFSESEKIIKSHKAQMLDYNAKKQREKQAVMARLQEQLLQRLANADEAEARDQKEQDLLKEEQKTTISRVLSTNMDLNEEAKNRILREHERNMQVLSNQLLASKIRQQKSLEIKLNQRKGRIGELERQKQELHRTKKSMKEKEIADLEADLASKIEKEELTLEEARKSAVMELRQQLAQETEEALKLHDEEISLLIGRLQIGQARRKAILEKQDQTLKQLQDELERRVAGGSSLPALVTDQIIKQYHNQVSHLNEQLQQRKKRQETLIQEKLSAKKQRMEEYIETQLEEEAQTEYTSRQKRGAGYASLALMQTFLEQRHAKAMQELDIEMQAELEKAKRDLNSELELELKKDLEMEHKDFLSQLAGISKMPQSDLHNAVSATTAGKSDNPAAKHLAKEVRESMSRSKTFAISDSSYRSKGDELAYKRANTDLNQPFPLQYDKIRTSSISTANKASIRPAIDSDNEDESEDSNGF